MEHVPSPVLLKTGDQASGFGGSPAFLPCLPPGGTIPQICPLLHRRILLDTTFWGGVRQAYKAGLVCETFQWGVSVHSSGELGIQLATMLHLGAALPNFQFAADAHYHHLTDGIIKGGKLPYRDGKIAVPTGPGLGVELDPDKFHKYAELYMKLGDYPYDRDPHRSEWYALQPAAEYAWPAK